MARWERIKHGLTPAEWRRAGGFAAAILALHLIGFALLGLSTGLLGVGVGITAYTLGLRHAFDADHIAAIDNTTRKLMSDGQRPLGVGFFFALGHSTVVLVLTALVAVGVGGLGGGGELRDAAETIGPSVSVAFLFLIGAVNLAALAGMLGVFRRMRSGELDEAQLEAQLANRGFLARIYKRSTRSITRSWQMYPVGVLFGLGFDTASEIGLLATAGTAVAGGLPWYAILCLPIMFAAGMTLLDTIDGAFMNLAYAWAFSEPVRRVFYNITVTGLSVAVALVVAGLEVAAVDLDDIGYAIAGLFAATWLIALAVWRLGRIEERWSRQ